jgi:hypothetical protein
VTIFLRPASERLESFVVLAICLLYSLFAFIALSNWIFMRRPKSLAQGPSFCVLIPARNEAENLKRLLPSLFGPNPGLKAYVYDDESEDGTAEIAASCNAIVIQPKEKLPEGWTGKNRACHELAKVAAEDSDADYWVFLDADVILTPEFIPSLRGLIAESRAEMLTGFPKYYPGVGLEPLFLAWVAWVLLALKPYGLICRFGKGNSDFTNGQIGVWKPALYTEIWPHEALKGVILEDVKIGRMLAKLGRRVEVANLSRTFGVHMYDTWRQALDGMSKNSYEVAGNALGTLSLALWLLFLAWGWLLVPWSGAILALSGVAAFRIMRAPFWGGLLVPLILTVGAFTMVRSLVWHRRGQVKWKGRTYSS